MRAPKVLLHALVWATASIASLNCFAMSPGFEQQWQHFRVDHPYHIQVVALSAPNNEGHRLLVISEPPPHVTVAALQAIDPQVFGELMVGTNPIGEDGWVRDILVDLPRLDDDTLRSDLDSLHRYLFHTSYKANVVPLDARPKSQSYNLDVRISAADLQRWLIDAPATDSSLSWWIRWPLILGFAYLVLKCLRRLFVPKASSGNPKRFRYGLGVVVFLLCIVFLWPSTNDKNSKVEPTLQFAPVEGGATTSLRQILESRRSGVFQSDQPGIVIWSVKRNADLDEDVIEAREFALDSDLILGAVASGDQIAIVGRERSIPIDALPPLRTETMLLLASANVNQLGQSYERTNIFAGKYDRHLNLDWAPIYLSRELIDTEYGSLLNITDQMLKSWSMNGKVRYVRFKYADPSDWPFPTPLIEYAKTSEVTFNWNTRGTGYSLPIEDLEYYALNRTGALPVDYLAADNSALRDAEDIAYNYFSARHDANLVRVVQYASLYQIFRKFKVTARALQTYDGPLPSNALQSDANILLDHLKNLGDDRIDAVSKAYSTEEGDALRKLRDRLNHYLQSQNGPGQNLLLKELVAPREQPPLDPEVEKLLASATDDATLHAIFATLPRETQMTIVAQKLAYSINKEHYLLQDALRFPLQDIKDRYERQTQRVTESWIRTPNVVVSRASGLRGGIGGHNLYAEASSFRLDPEIERGGVHVLDEGGRRVVVLNPEDADKATALVRSAARDGENVSPEELRSRLEVQMKAMQDAPVRERTEALGFSNSVRPDPSRGLEDVHLSKAVDGLGFRPTQQELDAEQKTLVSILESTDRAAVVVERTSAGKYVVLHSASKTRIEAADLASAQDAVVACVRGASREGRNVHLHVRGFSPEQGEGFIESAGLKFPKDSKPIVASMDERYLDANDVADILASRYDFKNVKIEEIPAEIVADGNLEKRGFEITADALDKSKPPLHVRIELFFDRLATNVAEVMASVRGVVERWTNQLAQLPDSADRLWALGQMRRELKALHVSGSVRVHLTTDEVKDIYVGTNRDPQSTVGDSHLAG